LLLDHCHGFATISLLLGFANAQYWPQPRAQCRSKLCCN
jgi:hypothetical protein